MSHNGMRPQDVAVLLKIIISKSGWQNKQIADSLFLSASEVSNSLKRSTIAGLISSDQKKVLKSTFLEFIRYGLPYVFPAVIGRVTIGVPTAYSAPVIWQSMMVNDSDLKLVWPYLEGTVKGESIEPLYPNAVKACLHDDRLYDLLAIVDVMRIGKIREKEKAMMILKELFNYKYA